MNHIVTFPVIGIAIYRKQITNNGIEITSNQLGITFYRIRMF